MIRERYRPGAGPSAALCIVFLLLTYCQLSFAQTITPPTYATLVIGAPASTVTVTGGQLSFFKAVLAPTTYCNLQISVASTSNIGDPDLFVVYNQSYTSSTSSACPSANSNDCEFASQIGPDTIKLYSAQTGTYYIAVSAFGANSVTVKLGAQCIQMSTPTYFTDVVNLQSATGDPNLCAATVSTSCNYLSSMIRVRNSDGSYQWISNIGCPASAFSNSFYQPSTADYLFADNTKTSALFTLAFSADKCLATVVTTVGAQSCNLIFSSQDCDTKIVVTWIWAWIIGGAFIMSLLFCCCCIGCRCCCCHIVCLNWFKCCLRNCPLAFVRQSQLISDTIAAAEREQRAAAMQQQQQQQQSNALIVEEEHDSGRETEDVESTVTFEGLRASKKRGKWRKVQIENDVEAALSPPAQIDQVSIEMTASVPPAPAEEVTSPPVTHDETDVSLTIGQLSAPAPPPEPEPAVTPSTESKPKTSKWQRLSTVDTTATTVAAIEPVNSTRSQAPSAVHVAPELDQRSPPPSSARGRPPPSRFLRTHSMSAAPVPDQHTSATMAAASSPSTPTAANLVMHQSNGPHHLPRTHSLVPELQPNPMFDMALPPPPARLARATSLSVTVAASVPANSSGPAAESTNVTKGTSSKWKRLEQ